MRGSLIYSQGQRFAAAALAVSSFVWAGNRPAEPGPQTAGAKVASSGHKSRFGTAGFAVTWSGNQPTNVQQDIHRQAVGVGRQSAQLQATSVLRSGFMPPDVIQPVAVLPSIVYTVTLRQPTPHDVGWTFTWSGNVPANVTPQLPDYEITKRVISPRREVQDQLQAWLHRGPVPYDADQVFGQTIGTLELLRQESFVRVQPIIPILDLPKRDSAIVPKVESQDQLPSWLWQGEVPPDVVIRLDQAFTRNLEQQDQPQSWIWRGFVPPDVTLQHERVIAQQPDQPEPYSWLHSGVQPEPAPRPFPTALVAKAEDPDTRSSWIWPGEPATNVVIKIDALLVQPVESLDQPRNWLFSGEVPQDVSVSATTSVHGVIRARWHGRILWQEQEEWDREREEAQAATRIKYESLVDQRALLLDELRKTPNLPNLRAVQTQLQRRMAALNREIKTVRERMEREQREIEEARQREIEDMRVISLIIEEFDFYG